jgi:hypothetical protein
LCSLSDTIDSLCGGLARRRVRAVHEYPQKERWFYIMRFWSKGLGERELVIDLSKGNLATEEGNVVMRGIVSEPVTWNYEIVLFKEDVSGILRVALSLQGILYFLKSIAGVGTYISNLGQMGSEPTEAKPAEANPGEKKPSGSAGS